MRLKSVSFAVLIVALTVIFIHPAYSANPLYEKYKGILADWHKAKICMPCHINTISGKQLERFLSCTPCHNEKVDLRNPKSIDKVHGTDICIKCHVGAEYSIKNLGLKVHVPHYKLDCSTCHGDKEISKPDARICSDCHNTNPHAVHGAKLDQMCTFCHSDRIYDFIKERPKEVEKVVKLTPTPTHTPEERKGGLPSLSDIIMSLLSFIFSK